MQEQCSNKKTVSASTRSIHLCLHLYDADPALQGCKVPGLDRARYPPDRGGCLGHLMAYGLCLCNLLFAVRT